MAAILIIDDEEIIRLSLFHIMQDLNHDVDTAAGLKPAMDLMKTKNFDMVFLDVNLPDGCGLKALPKIKEHPSNPEVIIITGGCKDNGAETAIKQGAWDYITKPFNKDEITLLVTRTIEYRISCKNHIKTIALDTGNIIGDSPEIKKCINQVAHCAQTQADVLITGETGTGKELFAKAVHNNSTSANGNYVVVDCAAMPESLTESLLFGHSKGAFTGADKDSEGLIKKAHKGTLFLDEIGELPLNIQKSFLRVLQEKKFRPVGSSCEISSDFRLISATNRNLEKMVSQGKFREDLYHRVKTIAIELPPLRTRIDDIRTIALHYINKICKKYCLKTKALLPETLEVLESYSWPGNVRELINSIEKAILSEPALPILYPMFLPDQIRIDFASKRAKKKQKQIAPNTPLSSSVFSDLYNFSNIPNLKDFRKKAIDDIENIYLKAVLKQTNWDINKTAKISGLSKSRVYYLVKKYHLNQIPV